MKPGRNDPCPCGSGEKYKRCYGAGSRECLIYTEEQRNRLIGTHDKKLAHIVSILPAFTGDLNQLFVKNEDAADIVPGRMQLIGIFTILDVLANYWAEYTGVHDTASGRFRSFLSRFSFVDSNGDYKHRKYLGDITIEELYEFRSGLVHFYGLYGPKYSILPHPSKKYRESDIDNWCRDLQRLSRMRGVEMHFVQPLELKKITIESAVGMLQYLSQREAVVDGEQRQKHVEGVDRIFQKLDKEGASVVDKALAEKLHEKMNPSRSN